MSEEERNPQEQTVRLIGGPADGQMLQIDHRTLEIILPVVDPTTRSCTDIIYVKQVVDGETVFICEALEKWNLQWP
jgi:hypothetical protein